MYQRSLPLKDTCSTPSSSVASLDQDNKLYVLGGINDSNFVGYNVSKLELIVEDAKIIRTAREDVKLNDLLKEIKKKKLAEVKGMLTGKPSTSYEDIMERSTAHQKTLLSVPQASNKEIEVSETRDEKFRGFVALPDAFMEKVINKKKQPGVKIKGLNMK